MAVIIGSARGDEKGGAHGGQAGDQTGKEVSTQSWYKSSKGWRVFRARDPLAREKIAKDMQFACDNSLIGYDQYQRDTLYKCAEKVGFDCSKVSVACETDCSALVRVCCAYAGIGLPNFNTETEPSVLLNCGAFDEMKGEQYTDSSDYLLRGDILVTRTKGHTVVVLCDGAKVDGVLCRGDKGEDVKRLQCELLSRGYSVGPDGADGDFGKNTESGIRAFQHDMGLPVTGIVDVATFDALKAPVPMYTVTISGLTKPEADGIMASWPTAKLIRE